LGMRALRPSSGCPRTSRVNLAVLLLSRFMRF
jgi:hypothetical protein